MSDFRNKSIAITGGSGTLGHACVRYLLDHHPEVGRIVIYSRDELKQLHMMEVFPEGQKPSISYCMGDVRDLDRLSEVLKGIDFVIHAAAIKHVVMAEKNPEECHKTNVLGTENVIAACLKNNVAKAVFISTDKAYNPIGVYGKSKQQAEALWLTANATSQCAFSAVRLGNIIGARGSVFEAFEQQRKTGVIKVTHPEATRFCISQEDAAKFVMDALQSDETGALTPEMESFRVLELAREIGPECEIEIIGLRPGDKLHEELHGVSSRIVFDALKN